MKISGRFSGIRNPAWSAAACLPLPSRERVPKAGEGQAGARESSDSTMHRVRFPLVFSHSISHGTGTHVGSGGPSPGLPATLSHKGRGTGLRIPRFSLACLCALALACWASVASAADGARTPLTVFAAASLKESLDEAATAYQKASGWTVRISYAASSALARQIEQGAPADVFLSADLEWMDYLQQRKLIDPATRHNLLGNTLVLVAPTAGNIVPVELRSGVDLLPRLGGNGRVALGLTASVPAGKYAKASFVSLGVWKSLEPRVAAAENVRAALMLVARGEAPLGVVYGSDAQAEPKVRVVGVFPENTHAPIVYPVARVAASGNPRAATFVHWLGTPAAAKIFRAHGFTVL